MTRVGTLLLVLVTLVGTGCAAQPAPTDTAEAGTLPWPARAATIVRPVEVGPWQIRRIGQVGLGGLETDQTDATLLAAALGVEPDLIEFEGAGSLVVRMPQGELSRTARLAGRPSAALAVLTADGRDGGARFGLQRTWFVAYEPEDAAEARGLVVLLPGMLGTPEPLIDPLVGKLRERGWYVLRMLTHSSRFTEKRLYMLNPDHPTVAADEIAEVLGDRAAECALAVEAACDALPGMLPDAPVDRRVALGMSGGGMVLPTVVARERDTYTGAVLMGAGCDYAAIAMESNYADWIDAVRIEWVGEPTDEARAAFIEAYRGAAPLDSYATAPLLAGLPMLVIHGEQDLAVPAHLGELLWERLGEPERWSGPLTHETLFLAYLPTRFGDLLDWLDEHAAP